MIVSENDNVRTLDERRSARSKNWEFVVVTNEGRVKHIHVHPQGNSSPWVLFDVEDLGGGAMRVGAPQLHPKAKKMGWQTLESLYQAEGRLSAIDTNGQENPGKTWLAFVEYHKLLRLGRIPRVTDGKGNRVSRGFPEEFLPDSVIELRKMAGAIRPDERDQLLASLGRGGSIRDVRQGSSGRQEQQAVMSAMLNPPQNVDVGDDPEPTPEEKVKAAKGKKK